MTFLTANGAQAAPWWGVPVLAGCFTVGGALLVVVANFLLQARLGKREDRRDDKLVGREEMRLINGEGRVAVSDFVAAATRFKIMADRWPNGEATDVVLGRLDGAFARIEILSSRSVVLLAQAVSLNASGWLSAIGKDASMADKFYVDLAASQSELVSQVRTELSRDP